MLEITISSMQQIMAGPADINVERWEDCDNPQNYQVSMGVIMAKINRTHAGITTCLALGSPMDENVILNVDVAKWGDGGWKPNALNHVGAACDTVMKYIKEPWEAFIHAAGNDEVICPLPENALNHVGAACDTVMKYIKEPWEAFIHAAGNDEVICPLPENALNHVGAACDTVMKYIKEPWEAFIHAAGNDEVICPLPEANYCIDKVTFDLTGLFPSMLYGYFRVDATLTVKGVPHRCLRMYVKSDPAKKSKGF